MKHISIIVAMARDRGIGLGNRLLYRLPNDLKRFKSLTTGHTVVMGRNTFESLPKGALPNRRNIVLSRREGAVFEGAECYASLEMALSSCRADEQVFIIGGACVYREALPLATRLYVTFIEDASKEADTFFPLIDEVVWKEISREIHHPDEKHPYPYCFIDYRRVK